MTTIQSEIEALHRIGNRSRMDFLVQEYNLWYEGWQSYPLGMGHPDMVDEEQHHEALRCVKEVRYPGSANWHRPVTEDEIEALRKRVREFPR